MESFPVLVLMNMQMVQSESSLNFSLFLFLLKKVVLGGGQEASAVTRTDHRAGKFEAKFYDKVCLPVFILWLHKTLLILEFHLMFFLLRFNLDSSRRNWWRERAFWTHKCLGLQSRW